MIGLFRVAKFELQKEAICNETSPIFLYTLLRFSDKYFSICRILQTISCLTFGKELLYIKNLNLNFSSSENF